MSVGVGVASSLGSFRFFDINTVLAAVIVFFALFNVSFSALSLSTLNVVFFVSIVFLVPSFFLRGSFEVDKKIVVILFLFGGQLCLYLITLLTSNSAEFSQLKVFFVFFFVYPFISFFVIRFFSVVSPEGAIKVFYYALLVQAFISILITLNGSFRDLVFAYTSVNQGRLDASASVRVIGFGSAYFSLATYMVLGGLLSLWLFFERSSRSIRGDVAYFLSFSLFFLIGVFSARTALVGFFVLTILFAIRFLLFRVSFNSLFSVFVSSFFLVVIVGFFVYRFPVFFDNSLPWAFEMFYRLAEDGEFSTKSTDHLKSMYFLPESFKTLFLGDGRMFDEGAYYMGSDVGYVRQIFSYGFLGMLWSFILYGFCFYVVSKVFGWWFSIALFLLYGLFNLKGIFVYYSTYDFFLVFCFCFCINRDKLFFWKTRFLLLRVSGKFGN